MVVMGDWYCDKLPMRDAASSASCSVMRVAAAWSSRDVRAELWAVGSVSENKGTGRPFRLASEPTSDAREDLKYGTR